MDFKIIECRRFAPPCPCEPVWREVKDYEIDIELGDGHIACIDGIEYVVKRGDILVRKPGQKVYCSGMVDAILLTLDFSSQRSEQNYSRNDEGPIQQGDDIELLRELKSVIRPVSEYTYIPIYNELLQVAFSDEAASKNLVMELLYKLNADQYRIEFSKGRTKESVTSIVLKYMKNNLSENITLDKLAQLVHMEKNYLVRIFKNAYGQSPINALISMRMEHASDLVVNTNMPITEIATLCGYTSPSYFISEYKRHFGETPLHRRKNKALK